MIPCMDSNLLGGWKENGELPHDMELLRDIVQNISFINASEYFENEVAI